MKIVVTLFFAVLTACSSSPSKKSTSGSRLDWTWTDGISYDDSQIKARRTFWTGQTMTPPDTKPPRSKLAKGVYLHTVRYDEDFVHNGFKYQRGMTYQGLRAHSEGKNGRNPFVLLPHYDQIVPLSIQEVYFRKIGEQKFQIINLDTLETRTSDITQIRRYELPRWDNQKGVLKFELFSYLNQSGEATLVYEGRRIASIQNLDSDLTSPYSIPPILHIKEKRDPGEALAVRIREGEKRHYQLYSLSGEKIGEPIDFNLVRHFYHTRSNPQPTSLVVQVDAKEDLYLPVGPKGIVSHPQMVGMRPLIYDQETLPPLLNTGDLPIEHLWGHTAVKWVVRVFPSGGRLLGWNLYSSPLWEQAEFSQQAAKELSSGYSGEHFKTFRPINVEYLNEDKTSLQTKTGKLRAYVVDSLDNKTQLNVMLPLYRAGEQAWPLEKYGDRFGSEKDLNVALGKRTADLEKDRLASQAKMKELSSQRAAQREAAERQRSQEQTQRQAYYNSIVQNGPQATDLATFSYEVSVYCQARGPRCGEFRNRLNQWRTSNNNAAEAQNMKRIQQYTNSGGQAPSVGSPQSQTTRQYERTVREGKERQEMKEFERQLDQRIKKTGR